MGRSYLTHSPIAWLSIVLMLVGFSLKYVVAATGWPAWLIPVGYFGALIGAAVMFVGWVMWKIAADAPET
ncbi:MAG: hypothetical protein AAGF30_15750 [Pseudomonadota bacterium]